jgi:hypothetical protein
MKRPVDLTSCWLVHGLRQDMADTMRQTRLREARARERERRGTPRASAAAAAEAACREVYFRDNKDYGSFVNSETGHSEDQSPNLRYALGSVKRVKVRATGDLRAHPRGVGHRPALPAYPRLVTDTPPWQVACRLRLGRAGLRGRAQAGSVPRIARRLRGKNVNLILAVARAGGGQEGRTSPSPKVPSRHQKKEKRAGSELGRGFEVKSPICRRSSEGIGRTE